MPVSYTHLDVYKRQSVYKGSSVRDSLDVIKFGDYTNQQDWAAVSQSTVSYTHLCFWL